MTVQIHLSDSSKTVSGWSTKIDSTQNRQLAEIPHWERPFVEGEMAYIWGLFNGLAAGPLEGHIELILHENLCTVQGEVTVYDGQTNQSLNAVLRMTTWMASGIAARFPKTDLRLRYEYSLKWNKEDD